MWRRSWHLRGCERSRRLTASPSSFANLDPLGCCRTVRESRAESTAYGLCAFSIDPPGFTQATPVVGGRRISLVAGYDTSCEQRVGVSGAATGAVGLAGDGHDCLAVFPQTDTNRMPLARCRAGRRAAHPNNSNHVYNPVRNSALHQRRGWVNLRVITLGQSGVTTSIGVRARYVPSRAHQVRGFSVMISQ